MDSGRVNGDTLYGAMGVDAHKGSVEKAFEGKINNEFPFAWVNITRDKRAPGYVRTTKIDGDGSKPTQNCLEYLETGNEATLESSADDSHAMVTIDAAAAGFTDEYVFDDVIDLNKLTIPDLKEKILSAYSRRIFEIISLHREYGIDEEFLGGETADLPSQTPSYICNGFLYARTHESDVIQGNIRPGDMIWGLASDGQALWETKPNSGIMCNGITLASAVLMHEEYNQKYPFLRHDNQKYRGRFRVRDKPDGLCGMTASEAIRSGTRQWALFLKVLYDHLKELGMLYLLHGVSVNTGGGVTKSLRLGQNVRYVKRIPKFPPIFQLIMEEGSVSPREMLEDFNCGIGVELIGSGEEGILLRAIDFACRTTCINYHLLGICESYKGQKNQMVILTENGEFTF
jgi:phosphoribosylformylglycinamidine cyclo-ligase